MSTSSSSALYRQWRSCINRTSLKCPQSSTCSTATYPRATSSSRFLLHNSAALQWSPKFCACRSVCSVVFGRLDPSHVMRSTCHVSFETSAAATPRDVKVSLFSANVSLHVPESGEEPAGSRDPRINLEDPIASDVASQNSDEFGTATLTDAFSTVAPLWLLERAMSVGYRHPTETQLQALPHGFAGEDCVIHAQTGSGKTLAYLLPLLASVNAERAAVQALVVVPTRELGMQVTRVARQLAGKGEEGGSPIKVMAVLDGGTASRQKAWLKADPPQVVVGTCNRLLSLLNTKTLRPNAIRHLVVDEVDAVAEMSKSSGSASLQKLLALLPPPEERQTVFASATVPQHRHFLQEIVRNKWTKPVVVHCHVTPQASVPPSITHQMVVCSPEAKLGALVEALARDRPRAAIVFTHTHSHKAQRAGLPHPSQQVAEYVGLHLTSTTREEAHSNTESESEERDDGKDEGSEGGGGVRDGEGEGEGEGEVDGDGEGDGDGDAGRGRKSGAVLVLVEEESAAKRAFTVQGFREGKSRILVSTDLAARGLDLPELSHVYNFDLPPDVTSYIHRAGRTGRRPMQQEGTVTSFVNEKEVFALKRIQNEIMVDMSTVEN